MARQEPRIEADQVLNMADLVIVVVDRDGIATHVNRKGCIVLGCSARDVLGRNWFDLFIHEDCRSRVKSEFAAMVKEGIVAGTASKISVLSTTGERCPLSWNTLPLRDEEGRIVGALILGGEVGLTQSHGDQVSSEDSSLRERQFHLVIDKSDQAICVLQRGIIRFPNERLCGMLGRSSSELESGSFFDYIHPDDRQRIAPLMADPASISERNDPTVFRIVSKTGEARWVEPYWSVVEWGGSQAVCVYLTDSSERLKSRDLLLRSARLRAVAELSSGVAHNFNNLLQIAQGYSELALLDIAHDRVADAMASLNIVIEKLHHGGRIVKALQDFTDTYTWDTPPRGAIFDLSQAVDKAIELSRPWLKSGTGGEGKSIDLQVTLQPGCFVEGGEGELLEVVVGLIKNAADALAGGGQISIATGIRDGNVFLDVSDTGVGIAAEDLGRIFQPFWTTKGSLSVGMGLPQSLGIVRRHGGNIVVTSEPSKGSVFSVNLPLATAPTTRDEGLHGSHGRAVPTVLLVDDEPLIVDLMERFLAKSGCKMVKALSGREAIEIFKEKGADLVICDLMMPEMNGWAVGSAIKSICEGKSIPKPPFLLLTAWSGQQIPSGDLEPNGIDEVVAKPIDFRKLKSLIDRFFQQSVLTRGR